jgi:hypothetical protein
MKSDPQILALIEDAFNRHASDPLDALAAVQKLALLHGAGPVLSALAQVHLVTAAHLRSLRFARNQVDWPAAMARADAQIERLSGPQSGGQG